MGLLDGLMGALGGGGSNDAISGIAGQLGIDPATAQNVAGSLMSNIQNGQSPQDAIQAAAQEHGVDPDHVSQIGDALGDQAGVGGLGGLASSLMGGGAGGGLGGMLGGLMGGSNNE